jgi:hypothetical protein
MVFNWFMAFMKILFGGKEWPSMQTFFVVSISKGKYFLHDLPKKILLIVFETHLVSFAAFGD